MFPFQRLLFFLRFPKYSDDAGVEKWKNDIVVPFLAQQQIGSDRLVSLLKMIMIRHEKVSFIAITFFAITFFSTFFTQ